MSAVPEATAILNMVTTEVPWPILYYMSKLQATEGGRKKTWECEILQHEESLINLEVLSPFLQTTSHHRVSGSEVVSFDVC